MSTDNMPDALDALVARSAPPVSPPTRSTSRAVSAIIRSAGRASRSPVSGRRRAFVFTLAGAGLVAATGAAVYTGTISDAWLPWGSDPRAGIEWQVAMPSGIQCINRLSSLTLSDGDMGEVEEELRDPAALLAADDGAVRELFLTEFALDGVDMEPFIDEAYTAFAMLDVDAGRGDIREQDLGEMDRVPEDELFNHIYMRLVENSLASALAEKGVALESYSLTPETACVVEQ